MAPGMMGMAGGRPAPATIMRQYAALISKDQLPIYVHLGTNAPFESKPLRPTVVSEAKPLALPAPSPLKGPFRRVILRDLCWGRSGDKGDTANIGIVARDPQYFDVIRQLVTPEVAHRLTCRS